MGNDRRERVWSPGFRAELTEMVQVGAQQMIRAAVEAESRSFPAMTSGKLWRRCWEIGEGNLQRSNGSFSRSSEIASLALIFLFQWRRLIPSRLRYCDGVAV